MKKIDAQMNLSKVENEILDFWDRENIFQKSIDQRDANKVYTFYDGPPFATGTPHYGHIVPSLMKDVVPRYWTMKGFRVERKWGWDCHGLPIENIAEKELGIKSKKEIEELGVDKFNEFCRSKVLGYVDEWKKVIRRMGRWADMDNAYKTMDLSYMESVWWVFKQLYDKGLIYEGYRSMHICTRCETTLSQSEVTEGYKDIKDLSVIAEFRLIDDPKTSILAWTTTPWTLIANVALAVGSDIKYSELRIMNNELWKDQKFIIASDRVKDIIEDEFEIIREFKGSELVGLKYQPLYDFYVNDPKLKNYQNGWQVVAAPFVTTEEGTGVVHIAPAFGEDDLNLGKKLNLPFIQHVGMDGIIKSDNGEFSGLSVKPTADHQSTDVEIIKDLAAKGLLFDKEKYEHSYPHCWRCDTPLINYATSSWFVAVEKVKDQAINLSNEISWMPNHIKKGRFGKWLEGARDWSISRQRYWASVMPIWRCECGEIRVFGSVSELEKASGQKVDDLHKHIVDKITVKCQKCGGRMQRIPDVLDTWFDSGSMPYAQLHYPFENKEKFETNFPAEFIAEGVDQTRAWFYYLHILATAVMEKPAFKNVIVNGIVLAEDGKKMSKRLKNYPDPMEMFEKYGADAMRFYLLSSPVMAAENINMAESEIAEISRGMFRMLWNSYYFFILYAEIDNFEVKDLENFKPKNILDKWILSLLQKLISDVEKSMTKYDLPKSVRPIPEFIDNLSNWYIRRSRKRFWKSENDDDKTEAYTTLFIVLRDLSRVLAPFCPFISEEIYKNLTGDESVHLTDFPLANKTLLDEKAIEEMSIVRKIVEIGLAKRAEIKIKIRQPLSSLSYTGENISDELKSIIAEETNVKEVKNISGGDLSVDFDQVITEDLKVEGLAREIIRTIQTLRKEADFKIDDRIEVYYQTESMEIKSAFSKLNRLISDEILAENITEEKFETEFEKPVKVEGQEIIIGLKRK